MSQPEILDVLKQSDDFEKWLEEFSAQDLVLHGWTSGKLSQTFKNSRTLLGYDGSRLASCLIYHQVDTLQFEVLFLATAPQWRRKGYQEALLLQIFEAYPQAGLWLECRADNQAALSLYKKCGLIETGTRPRYYNDGMAAILMSFLPSTGAL